MLASNSSRLRPNATSYYLRTSSKSTIQAVSPKRALLVAGATAVLALAAMGFSGGAHARGDVSFSVGVVIPGVQVGVTHAYPVYTQPVYVQPQPVVYVWPAPVYVAPVPVYYGRPHGWNKRHDRHDRDDDDDRGYRKGGYYMHNQVAQPYVHGPRGFQPPGYYYGR